MRGYLTILAATLVLGACGGSQATVPPEPTGYPSEEIETDTESTTTTTSKSDDGVPNVRTGHVILDGVAGGSERCNMDTDRKVSLDWLGPEDGYSGPPLPLHVSFTGAGGRYAEPYIFESWANLGLEGKDNLDGAFNIVIRFECMNDPEFSVLSTGPQAIFYLADLGWNPHDVNYVYELLCTDLHEGTPDASKVAPIDESQIDCTQVGLTGTSGGGLTAQMFLNECFEDMTITPHIKAIASVVAGFWPFGSCTVSGRTGFAWKFDAGIPLFMKVACSDARVPYGTFGRDQWPRMSSPKFLYKRSGPHSDFDAPGGPAGATLSFLAGEDLIRSFMRYYLLGDEGPTGLGGLDDYPDRPEVNRPAGFETSYQYDGPIGTKLDGGLC